MARFQRGYVALSQAAAAAGSTFAYGEPGLVEIEAQLEKLGQLVSRLITTIITTTITTTTITIVTTTTTSHRGRRTSQNPTAGPNSAASAPAAGGPITHLRARRRGLCRSADDTRSRSAVGPPQRTTTCLKL